MNEELILILMTKRLTGEISNEEEIALDDVLEKSEALQKKYSQLAAYWNTSLKQDSTTEAWKKHQLRLGSITSKPRIGKRVWYVAASVLVLWGSMYFYLRKGNKEPTYTSNIQTLIGKKRILLPDSSVVVLNSNSTLEFDSIDFSKGNRTVRFQGEGYFDIHHDKRHPFSVHIATGTIKVLGTAFNITSYNRETIAAVSLIRGKVAFEKNGYSNKEDITLLPNQKLVIAKPNETSKQDALKIVPFNDIEMYGKYYLKDTSWMADKIIMKNDRLGAILLGLEHRYGVTFQVEDESIKDYVFSGELGQNSLDAILSALTIVHPFNYKIEKGTVVLRK